MRRILVLLSTMTIAVLAISGAMLFGMGEPALSQSEPPCNFNFCLDKRADKDTVTVGEQITFTITERCVAPTGCFDSSPLVDQLPSGLTVDSVDPATLCSTSGNTVTCGERSSSPTAPFTLTIVATPTECGSFTNTASHGGGTSATATATFTVVGCPPPTKEECKKGGWMKFGFPDQGTCVSAVNRQNRQ